jgi:hypothetical protein
MGATDQPVFLLQVLVNLVPPAAYFLILGLVNSSSHPILISGRRDFLALVIVFLPLIVWPLPALVGLLSHLGWWSWLVLGGGVVLISLAFRRLLPGRWQSWVIYNISEAQCRGLLRGVLREMHLDCEDDESNGGLRVPAGDLRMSFGSFPLLRNVSLQVEPIEGGLNEPLLAEVIGRLRCRLGELALLPSTGGACLLLIGVVLLALPLCMMSRHVGVIVDMVTRLLFA